MSNQSGITGDGKWPPFCTKLLISYLLLFNTQHEGDFGHDLWPDWYSSTISLHYYHHHQTRNHKKGRDRSIMFWPHEKTRIYSTATFSIYWKGSAVCPRPETHTHTHRLSYKVPKSKSHEAYMQLGELWGHFGFFILQVCLHPTFHPPPFRLTITHRV